MTSLDLLFARPIEPPPVDEVSPPQPFSGGDVPVIVFHDSATVWGYTPDGERLWFIPAQARSVIRGLAVNKTNLYVLDGHVLCQYAAETLQTGRIERPANAVSFGEAALSSWQSDTQDPDVFDRLFAAPPQQQTLSTPLCNDADNTVHVLRGDGTVYALPENLDARAGNPVKKTGLVPDDLALYLAPGAKSARICWISGGKVADAASGELEAPAGGIDRWRAQCLASSSPPAWRAISQDFRIISPYAYGGSSGTAMIHRLPGAAWSFHILMPECLPAFGEDIVLFQTFNPPNPVLTDQVYLVTLPPIAPQMEVAGTLELGGSRNAAIEHLSAPCVPADEPSCMYFAVNTGTGPNSAMLVKYRLPATTTANDWTLSWLADAQATISRLGPAVSARPPGPEWSIGLPDINGQYAYRGGAPAVGAAIGSIPSALWQSVKANRWPLGLMAHYQPGVHPAAVPASSLSSGGVAIAPMAIHNDPPGVMFDDPRPGLGRRSLE